MKTLFALDSSGATAGVCVARGGDIVYEKSIDEGLTHSQTLLPLVARAFEETGLSAPDVDVFCVAAGPGSFTGLRIGVALVKGLALPRGTLAAPVSTLLALAHCYAFPGIVVPALNARRGEVYWAAFDGEAGMARLAPDGAAPVSAVQAWLSGRRRRVIFVGDGEEICYTNIKYGHLAEGTHAGPPNIACGVARAVLAAGENGPAAPPDALRPVYLRLSQAERERAARARQAADG